MISELTRCFARANSVQRALALLDPNPGHALIIAPSTPGAFALARALCKRRQCFVSNGPISSHSLWGLKPHLRTPAELAQAFAGQSELPRTVVSFPDQHHGLGPAPVIIPFLGGRYSFSSIEALLVMRHRPPVYALVTCSETGGFLLNAVRYDELFTPEGRLLSLPGLARRLLMYLEQELMRPAPDWLAQECFRLKSEAQRSLHLREELKDIECLLRLHLTTRYCDQLRTETALAAVIARQKNFTRTPSQRKSS